jgi:hypothetical protein
MTPNNPIKELIAHGLGPRLRESGFKKRETTWNRRIEGVQHVVDLQVSRDSFTLNFGVFLEEVWRVCWLKPAPRFIHESDCFPRFRIGQLLSGFQETALDKWWRFEDEDKAMEEVEDAVFGKGLGVLDGICTDHDALAFARENLQFRLPLELLYLGVLEYQCGEISSGVARLERLLSDHHWGKRAQTSLDCLNKAECGSRV